MRYLGFVLLLAVSSFTLTGCFELLEEVHYRKDGSGTYKFTMDMSQMKAMLEMAMSADTTGSVNLDTLSAMPREMSKKLQGMPGITNIKEINDMENFVFGVEYEFKDIEALNNATMASSIDPELGKAAERVFTGSKKSFERLNSKAMASALDEAMGAAGEGEEAEMAMMFLKDVSFTFVYNFDRKVKKVSNSLAKISDDKKSVTLKYFLFDEERGGKKGSVGNAIKLK